MSRFEKVSLQQFTKDFLKLYPRCDEKTVFEVYENILLPTRGTKGSAGYDFFTPFDFCVNANESVTIPTGIRWVVDDDKEALKFLMIVPRSGLGFKYQIQLSNTAGIIDESFYKSDNEGHIFIKLINRSIDKEKIVVLCKERFAQGIIIPYEITENDNTINERNGGFGSTGK